MAYDRKKKGGSEPAVEFRWDPLQLASDKTFSTIIRIYVSGWWPEGRPQEIAVSYYQRGETPADGNPVRIQEGRGTFPLTGLKPGRHYHVVVYKEDRPPVQDIIMVPELPKPPRPEVEALERERTELERARVARQLKQEKAEPPEPKRQVKVLHSYRRPSRLEVVLQRIGKDGKPEDGGISVLDFEQGGIVFGDATGDFPVQEKKWGIVVVFLPYFDYSRQVTFFLPDDTDAKVFVDVPARTVKEEKKAGKIPKPSLFRRMREAYVQERDKEKVPAFEFKIQRRQPLIFLPDLPLHDLPKGEQNGR